MRKLIYGSLTLVVLGCVMNAQPQKKSPADKQAQTLINRLKATPVADIETGLPADPFGKWFAKQAKPGQPQYEVKPCEAATGGEKTTELMCVVASAKVGEMKKLELTFAMGPYSSAGKKAKGVKAKAPACRFLVGSLGPSDPRMKFPTKVVAKLSDLPPLLNP